MARPRGRWLWGALASGGKEHTPPFSSEYSSLLCKDSGGYGGVMRCPDYTDQCLAELPSGLCLLRDMRGSHPLSIPSSTLCFSSKPHKEW